MSTPKWVVAGVTRVMTLTYIMEPISPTPSPTQGIMVPWLKTGFHNFPYSSF